MSDTEHHTVRAAELRRRIRAAEELRLKTCELAAADVLATHNAAKDAARAKKHADAAASEAAAAALRLFGDVQTLAQLTELSATDLDKAARSVTAARAAQLVEELGTRAEQPKRPRRRATAPAPPPTDITPETPGDTYG